MILATLCNEFRPRKNVQRVGRGSGSGRGKTSCRGNKGDKSRSGYKTRGAKEGGQLPLFKKLPTRGFSNARFALREFSIGFDRINDLYEDGEVVSLDTLYQKGLPVRRVARLKVLGNGALSKKVAIHAHVFTSSALKHIESNGVEFSIVE